MVNLYQRYVRVSTLLRSVRIHECGAFLPRRADSNGFGRTGMSFTHPFETGKNASSTIVIALARKFTHALHFRPIHLNYRRNAPIIYP